MAAEIELAAVHLIGAGKVDVCTIDSKDEIGHIDRRVGHFESALQLREFTRNFVILWLALRAAAERIDLRLNLGIGELHITYAEMAIDVHAIDQIRVLLGYIDARIEPYGPGHCGRRVIDSKSEQVFDAGGA